MRVQIITHENFVTKPRLTTQRITSSQVFTTPSTHKRHNDGLRPNGRAQPVVAYRNTRLKSQFNAKRLQYYDGSWNHGSKTDNKA